MPEPKRLSDLIPLVLEAAKIRKAIMDRILDLPDNQLIDKGSNECRCFTVNVSQLQDGLTLSPEYYDFNYQYQEIAKAMIDVPIENTIEWFNKLIKAKSIKVKGYTIKLHPEVIQNIESIL